MWRQVEYLKDTLIYYNTVGREEKDDAFHVCDLGDVVKKWKKWNDILPNVQPFYGEFS